ncbi:Uncharacterised protein [Vibrio cholerae]|nr:Uncharacterised protein [Vibrio cholerae]
MYNFVFFKHITDPCQWVGMNDTAIHHIVNDFIHKLGSVFYGF